MGGRSARAAITGYVNIPRRIVNIPKIIVFRPSKAQLGLVLGMVGLQVSPQEIVADLRAPKTILRRDSEEPWLIVNKLF